jgi:hypothetical protein
MKTTLILLACLFVCGCDSNQNRAMLQSEDKMVPLDAIFSKDRDYVSSVEIATLNELRQIKIELQKMNATKEGKDAK